MKKEFRLQDPGEGIHEAEIREIAVSEGDEVAEGDTVFVAETDKAAVDLPAPYAGRVASIDVDVDDVVEVGDLLMTIETGDADEEEEKEEEGKEKEEEPDAETKTGREKEAEAEAGGKAAADGQDADAEEVSPDRRRADEAVDAKAEETEKPAAAETEDREAPAPSTKGAPVKATPAVRRLARELDVDLSTVEPSGDDGRVSKADVRQAGGKAAEEPSGESGGPRPSDGEAERIPLRSVRRAVAKAMARSWAEIPHVTHHDRVDVTDLESIRRRQQEEATEDAAPLTLTSFLIKATAAALVRHQRFNASLDQEAEEIVVHPDIHIGVATATDRGLLVPVIRNADAKDILTIAEELADLTAAAQDGSIGRDQLRGATFSITNVGPLGGTFFTPIINPPQAAILGIGRAALTPVVDGDLDDWRVVARLMMPLSLAFDHRLNDGADAARFVTDLAGVLADPERLLLRA